VKRSVGDACPWPMGVSVGAGWCREP
jgi:hypothetical protein